jgi:hypothetical protein
LCFFCAGREVLVGIGISSSLGILLYFAFVLWRGTFTIYSSRLISGAVPLGRRPPLMRLGGHHQLWSWLVPVFSVSDGELLRKAGLDALVAQRILGFCVAALLPPAVLGTAV